MKRETLWKNLILFRIADDYIANQTGKRADWSGSFFSQTAGTLSCLGDLAKVLDIRPSTKGWSKSQVLWERLKRHYNFMQSVMEKEPPF